MISFTSANDDYANTDLSSSPSQPAIAVLWDDLVVDNTGTGTASSNVYWQLVGSGASQQLIIQWNNVHRYNDTVPFTFQAVLSKDGTVQLNYDASVPSSVVTSATAGIKGSSASLQKLLLSYNQSPSTTVGGGRSTVLSLATVPDYYSFSVAANQTASFALTGGSNLELEVRNSLDAVLATGAAGATNFAKSINNFTGAPGTYYVRVASNDIQPYSLVVIKDAVYDTEGNDTAGTAQPLGSSRGGTGYVTGSAITASYDYESGLQGWTINNGSTGLWALSTRRGTEANHSQVTSFHYGTETGTFDTGVTNSGTVTSPSFVVAASAALSFNYVLLTEASTGWDKADVQISVNGGANWTTILGRSTGVTPLANTSTWSSASVSLSPYAGQTAQIRFQFDTVDNISNSFEGWYVDDVTIGQVANDDWYAITLPSGFSGVTLKTSTPSDGAGEFVNTLDPTIRLYDAAGTTLLGTGVALPDGRNESLTVGNLTPGSTYMVRMSAAAATKGEYFFTRRATDASNRDGYHLRRRHESTIDGQTDRGQLLRIGELHRRERVHAHSQRRQQHSARWLRHGRADDESGEWLGHRSDDHVLRWIHPEPVARRWLLRSHDRRFEDFRRRWRTSTAMETAPPAVSFSEVGTTSGHKLFRLFGDSDGSGGVDFLVDFIGFRNAFANAGPNPIFDFDNSNTVDFLIDFIEFRNRFNATP